MTMRIKIQWWSFLILSVILTFTTSIPVRSYAKIGPSQEKTPELNREELQAAVVNHVDRFIAIIGQAAFEFELELPTQEARLISARRKVYTMSAAVTIAAGPDPAVAMLDMIVLSTLNHMVWEDYWQPKVFDKPATTMVNAFKKTEDDIFSIAAKLLSPRQLIELRELIADWHAQHPDQFAVDFIRFSDFGELGRKPELKKIKAPGGLLAPVKEAVQAADEIRLMSERAMFLITKMQLILGLQAELVYKELVMQPEVTDLLGDLNDFKKIVDELPDQLTRERQAAIKDIAQRVSNERQAVLKAFDDRESKLRAILADTQATMDRADDLLSSLQQTMVSAEKIVEKTESTGKVFNELVGSVDRLAARLEAGEPKEASEPFDIKDYILALEKLNQTIRDTTVLVGAVDQHSAPMIQQLLAEFNTAAERRIDHLFWLLAILIVLMGIMGVVIVIVHHRLKAKAP